MKRRFSKILGVGLTLALLVSLLLTAAPVSATIANLSLSLDTTEISADATYTMTFTAGAALDTAGDTITVTFPTGADITGIGTVGLAGTPGIGGVGTPTIVDTPVVDGQVLTITVTEDRIGAGSLVQVVVPNVTNPDTVGVFILSVATSAETTAISATFTTTVPTIDPLPGVVEVRNPSGILMANFTGPDAIDDAIGIVTGADYTINVGAGTYEADLLIPATHTNLELIGAEGAVIKGIIFNGTYQEANINVLADGVKIHGFTIQGPDPESGFSSSGMIIGAKDVEIYDNAFEVTNASTSADGSQGLQTWDKVAQPGVDISGLNIQDNTFTDHGTGTWGFEAIYISLDTGTGSITIADNQVTGDIYRAFATGRSNTIISGNSIITDLAPSGTYSGISVSDSEIRNNPLDAVAVTGNTIKGSGTDEGFREGIRIGKSSENLTNISVTNNTLEGNDVGVLVRSSAEGVSVNFNNIIDSVTLGVSNIDTETLNATFNWWGTAVATEIADMVSATGVTYEPFLTATQEAVVSDSEVGSGTTLDASTTVGVAVSVVGGTADNIITVAKYTANPEAGIADAIAFYDVYVTGTFDDPANDSVTIKFYAGDTNTVVYIWAAGTDMWVPQATDFSAYGGYVYVTVDPAMLAGTPFALVGGAAAAIDTPLTFSPDAGERGVPLTPTFSWEDIPAAAGYYFELADNAHFVTPLVKLDGDLGRLIVTAYAYVGELDYSTAYYWRVRAASGTVAAGTLAQSAWASGVFITMDEPVEPTPPIVIEETPAPIIVIEETPAPIIQPIVEVITPPATPITPAWIYVIIAVGAVLVIALLVLIVRTRRVA